MMHEHEIPVDLQSKLIPVSAPQLRFGNVEAWINIIHSYKMRHPEHLVRIRYHGEAVNNLGALFRLSRNPDPGGFEVEVDVTDGNRRDLAKLFRLVADAASEDYERYINKELFQVLNLF